MTKLSARVVRGLVTRCQLTVWQSERVVLQEDIPKELWPYRTNDFDAWFKNVRTHLRDTHPPILLAHEQTLRESLVKRPPLLVNSGAGIKTGSTIHENQVACTWVSTTGVSSRFDLDIFTEPHNAAWFRKNGELYKKVQRGEIPNPFKQNPASFFVDTDEAATPPEGDN